MVYVYKENFSKKIKHKEDNGVLKWRKNLQKYLEAIQLESIC